MTEEFPPFGGKTQKSAELRSLPSHEEENSVVHHAIHNWDSTNTTMSSEAIGTIQPSVDNHHFEAGQNRLGRDFIAAFKRLGFTVQDGPEIDTERCHFDLLGLPRPDFRGASESLFYLEESQGLLLRSHTANNLIHAMLRDHPPMRVVSVGRSFSVAHPSADVRIHRVCQAFLIDRGISLAHMKGVILGIISELLGAHVTVDWCPTHVAYLATGFVIATACPKCQSAGCDHCDHRGKLALGTAGMIHPNVFESVDYDSDVYTGFVIELSLDRLAMCQTQSP